MTDTIEEMRDCLDRHMARWGEHFGVHVDVGDLSDWLAQVAALQARLDAATAVVAAARSLADCLPPSGAALPHAALGAFGEYRTARLLNLRDALAAYDAAPTHPGGYPGDTEDTP